MTYRKIDTSKVKPEMDMDFEQIQKDLAKFKNHNPMPQDDAKTLMNYISKYERLISDESYSELEYSAECFMCTLREILANVKQEPRKRALTKCADRMGITVQKTNGVLEVTLPMLLPTKSKTKADYLFDPIFHAMESFAKTESLFMKEKAMMCIEFIYDKNNKNIPRGYHDNKEVKQVIDAIAPFIVQDDSDEFLSLCQISTEGDYNHMAEIDRCRWMIKDNIDYYILVKRDYIPNDMLDEIVELIVETICSKNETITIASNTYPHELVKSKFLKINIDHIEYIIDCVSKNTTKVNNIKQYLLAAIFNAPNTIGSYFTTKVNHDSYG